jgi:hypothetical protein
VSRQYTVTAINPPTPEQAAEMVRRAAPAIMRVYRSWERRQAEEAAQSADSARDDGEGADADLRTA